MLDLQQGEMLALYEKLKPYAPEYNFHNYQQGMYYKREAMTLYTMLRHFKPKLMIEVVAGHSSNVASRALDKNVLEPGAPPRAKHIIVEPYRSFYVKEHTWSRAQVLLEKVQDVPMSLYEQLGENDLLFIDSSHAMQPYGCTRLFMMAAAGKVQYNIITRLLAIGTVIVD